MTETASELKTASFKLYRESTKRFTIDYKEKDDLYQSFQRKIGEYAIPHESVYFVNRHGYHISVKDSDTLFRIVKDNPKVRVTVRSDDDHSYSSSDSVEHLLGLLNGQLRGRTRTRRCRSHSRSKSRGHSRCKSRGHSRSKSREHSRSKSRDHSRTRSRRHSRSTDHWCGRFGHCHPPGFYSEFSDEFDHYFDQPPSFSRSRSPCFPVDPRIGYGLFCGMGRGRGRFHYGGMRGAFHG